MNSSWNQGSAKIYQFPAGGRAALGGRSYSESDQYTPRVSEALCSSSWYHEEAIRESQAATKPLWDR